MSMDTSFQIAFYNDLNIFDQKKIDAFVCRCYQETVVSSIHLPKLNVLYVCMWNGNQMIGYSGIFLCPFKVPNLCLRRSPVFALNRISETSDMAFGC